MRSFSTRTQREPVETVYGCVDIHDSAVWLTTRGGKGEKRDWCWRRFAEVALPLDISELIMRGLPDRIGICTAHRTSTYTCVTRNHYLVYTIHTSCNRRIASVLLYLANGRAERPRRKSAPTIMARNVTHLIDNRVKSASSIRTITGTYFGIKLIKRIFRK